MGRARLVQVATLLLAAAALAAAVAVQGRLDAVRAGMDTAVGEGLTGSYPELKALQALPGGVRAVLIDYLWIRSEKLKRQGKVFDAVQLADMICTLEAHFPGVWGYQAWNLAYNISVEAQTPAERWHWVKAGIELLRDRGLKYHPKSLDLYRELGWTYFHKVGERTDDMHLFYKRYLAAEYHRVLGAPPRAGGMAAYRAWLRPVVEAPDRPEELLADPAVAAFVAELAAADVGLDLSLLDAYSIWGDDADARMIGQPVPRPGNDAQRQLAALMTDPARASARAKAIAFARKRVITATYKLKPAYMLELAEYYGPLDWRLAQTHGLYWSTYGLQHIKGLSFAEFHKLDQSLSTAQPLVPVLNTHRNILNCLKQFSIYGRIALVYNPANPELPELMEEPDWQFIEVCHHEHIARKEYLLGVKDNQTYESLIPGHVNFLADAIVGLYLRGHREEAQRYFSYVRDTYKKGELDWNLPLQDYVYRQIGLEGPATRQQAFALTMGLIENAYRQGLMGYADEMALSMESAALLRDAYDKAAQERNRIAPLHSLQSFVADRMLGELPAAAAMELYEMLPPNVQRAVYDHLATFMPGRCQEENLDFARAFPEPEGMAAFRQRRQEAMKQSLQPRQKMAGEE